MSINVFEEEDFVLCHVPVPEGYPQSQTHCTILKKGDDYYLTSSPYPTFNFPIPLYKKLIRAFFRRIGLKKLILDSNGEKYENPCLYKAVGYNNERIPVKFELIKGSPLMQTPPDVFGKGGYCSDPDLYIENDSFYIINRVIIRKDHSTIAKDFINSFVYLIEGSVINKSFLLKQITLLFQEFDLSPCLTFYSGKYFYFSLDTNSYNDGSTCKYLYYRTSKSLNDGWSEKKIINVKSNLYTPWHISVFSYNEYLFSIVTCIIKGQPNRCYQMLGEFDSKFENMIIYEKPLTNIPSYRGSAYVSESGEFVLYTTTVNNKMKCSTSVDGRDILMAHTNFEALLKELRENCYGK